MSVYYTGHVQGVGFRWTTAQALSGLPVTGFVRNLTDGRVEMVIEGTPADNKHALEQVERALGHLIHAQSQVPGAATGEFDGFGVRR